MTTHLRLSFISYMQCGMKLARHLALSPETRKEACDLLATIHIECVHDPPTKYTLGVQEQIELIMQVSQCVVKERALFDAIPCVPNRLVVVCVLVTH